MPVNTAAEADDILDRYLDAIGAGNALLRDPLYAAQVSDFREWFRKLSLVLHDEGLGTSKRSMVLRRVSYIVRGPAEADERLRMHEAANGDFGSLERLFAAAMQDHPWRPVIPSGDSWRYRSADIRAELIRGGKCMRCVSGEACHWWQGEPLCDPCFRAVMAARPEPVSDIVVDAEIWCSCDAQPGAHVLSDDCPELPV